MPTENELDEIFNYYSEELGFENLLLKYKTQMILPWVHGPSVLDVGCGVGFLCRTLSDTFEKIVGLDGSPVKISRAEEINAAPNVSYICSMFDPWTADEKFDTILATNILEHVDDAVGFLKKCWSLLAVNGRIIITVPNALGLHKRIGMHMKAINDYYKLTEADLAKGHQRIYDRQRLERDVKAAGFNIKYSSGILLKPLSSGQMEQWDTKIVDALFEVGKELPDYCSSLMVVGVKQNG